MTFFHGCKGSADCAGYPYGTGFSLRLLVATLGAALVMWLGGWLLSALTFEQRVDGLVLTGNQLRLVNAPGERTDVGLRILTAPDGKPILILGVNVKLSAGRYEELAWDIEGLTETMDMALVWQSSTVAGKSLLRPISTAERAAGRLQLQDDPEWRGEILRLGLLLGGRLAQPLLVKALTLEAAAPRMLDLPNALAADWWQREPWTLRSINFHAGATRGRLLTPVSALALWLGLSGILFIVWRPYLPLRHLGVGLVLMFLVGWLLLDLRWQWQLASRLQETSSSFGQPASAFTTPDPSDGTLLAAIDQVRQALPTAPARLFILTEDPGGFIASRLSYLLLPHRGYAGLSQLPEPTTMAAGDAILVLSTLRGIRYDKGIQRLLGAGGETLAAELVLEVPGFGTLYRASGIAGK